MSSRCISLSFLIEGCPNKVELVSEILPWLYFALRALHHLSKVYARPIFFSFAGHAKLLLSNATLKFCTK